MPKIEPVCELDLPAIFGQRLPSESGLCRSCVPSRLWKNISKMFFGNDTDFALELPITSNQQEAKIGDDRAAAALASHAVEADRFVEGLVEVIQQ